MENGWCETRIQDDFIEILDYHRAQEDEIEHETLGNGKIRYRPKSLQGIENNNGWIKIESENDLPKEHGFYDACYYNEKHKNDIPMFYACSLPDLSNYYEDGIITHYQPIDKKRPPIY